MTVRHFVAQDLSLSRLYHLDLILKCINVERESTKGPNLPPDQPH